MPRGQNPTPEESVAFVAANVRHHRVRCGLTQEELAELVDVPPLRIQRVERGLADIRVTTLVALASALGVSVSALFQARKVIVRESGRPKKSKRSAR